MLACLVALVGVSEAFNPFGDNTCPCDTGGGSVDFGLPPIAEAATVQNCKFLAHSVIHCDHFDALV